ncbi:MAG: folylpolyglutamate synthase/dihydrofolate synthase family protein [Candidatus Neomarinimicrobiota bacterium]|jgi:dihydrofolate synthase/folylpolyglutamate synthase|nr:bifunctional folylpolyglutamate synthase/dihydrofolate synthase [Candidatus Neomarinimicrobiota bacterium]MDX9779756.1 folylpolyglutamate synthase/dihydrofolate synthase family protein [bacterium]
MQDYLSELYRKLSGQMKLGRERCEALMEGLGHPEGAFRSVHVAGTNGKGSVVALTASLLQAAGLKVGRFTSPHLVHFNERISINGQNIDDASVKEFLEKNRALLDRTEASFFEVSTALAFDYFRKQKIDVAVVETGLGGRLDATGVLQPEVSVITSIGRDHMEILGETLTQIAGEKAGIIRNGVPLVTCPQEVGVLEVFRRHTQDIEVVDPQSMFTEVRLTPLGMRFFIYDYARHFSIPLVGRFQLANIAMALKAAARILQRPPLQPEIVHAFEKLVWKGRFERLGAHPERIYDVAHNPDGVRVFCETLAEVYPQRPRYAVLGILKDKQPAEVLNILQNYVQRIWLCPLPSHRSLQIAELKALTEDFPISEVAESISGACDAAARECGEKGVLAVLGSHYIAGELYRWSRERNGAAESRRTK